MIIEKLNASFGQLENRSLTLHEGLNVIYAPNESGKSTWCAFIMAMLYGVDSSERSRSGYLPDKLRYAPWSGAPMEGSMVLRADRRSITLTRSTKAKSAPMQSFTAFYTGTTTPVNGLTAANAGETLTGVPKNVFRRSAFIGQGAIAVNGNPDLEKRISAIVSTGEETAAYSEIDARLRGWQRKRRFNRKGFLPELESRMSETERRLEDMSGAAEELDRLTIQLEQLRTRAATLENEVNEARMRQRREVLDSLSQSRLAVKSYSAAHDEAMAELSLRRAAVREHPLGNLSRGDAHAQLTADAAEAERLQKAAAGKRSPLPAVLLLLLAVLAAVARGFIYPTAMLAVSAVLALGGIALLLRSFSSSRTAADAADARLKLLRKYRASSAEDIRSLLQQYTELCDAVQNAVATEEIRRKAYDTALKRQEALEQSAIRELDFAAGDSEAAGLGRELSRVKAEMNRITDRISHLNGRFAAMGDPLVLNSDLNCMRKQHSLLSGEYDAIDLAADVLNEADEELQSRFAPALGALAGRYFSVLTGGRYTEVLLNRDFTAMAKTAGDSVAHESGFLSAGTMDLMYLAVRLAVCELALPDSESCPLVIDDALVNLDDSRLSRAMTLLKEIAQSRQVILFSCRNPDVRTGA